MYYLIVPEPVTLLDIVTGEKMVEEINLANGNRIQTDKPRKPLTLFQLVCDIAFSDAVMFGAGWKAALALQAIHGKLKNAKPGEVVVLEDDHLERLRKSLLDERDNRTVVYDPRILMQAQPLLKSLKEAMTEEEFKTWREKHPAPAEE